MAAADYRLMTEATGQRIAAALEALSGTGAAAAAARANLDVYSTGETDELIAQSTANKAIAVVLTSDDDTVAKIATKLLALPNGQTATFWAHATPAKMLSTSGSTTNPKIAEAMYGTVTKIGSGAIRITARLSGNSQFFVMSATVTTGSITTDSIYRFTGTAL